MQFSFSHLRHFIRNLFGKRGALGIDVGASAIKIVELERKGSRAVLHNYGEISLAPYAKTDIGRATNLPTDQLAFALSDLIREAKFSASECAFAIPLSASILRMIEIPFISEEQLASVVPIEARKYIPTAITEVTLNWQLVPRAESMPKALRKEEEGALKQAEKEGHAHREKIDVLIAAIRNETLGNFEQLARAVRLEPVFFEIEPFSTVRSVVEPGLDSVFICDFGAATSKFYVVEGGVVESTHIVNRGSQDISLAIAQAKNVSVLEAERLKRSYGVASPKEHRDVGEISSLVLINIFSEAAKVLEQYEAKVKRKVKRIILTGGGALLPGLTELVRESFDREVSTANPFARLQGPAFLLPVLKELGPGFSAAIGVALRHLEEHG